jgi:hypothetical protein
MACISQETVVALMEGRLSDGEAADVDHHMDDCATCRAMVAEVARGSLVRPIDSDEVEVPADDEPIQSRSLVPGQMLGPRYKVVKKLGQGGMGVV